MERVNINERSSPPAGADHLSNSSCESTHKSANVWVVVLHYGGPEHTRQCLVALSRLTFKPSGILLTDNCSPDASGRAIADEFPTVHFQQLPQNLGFAGGSNAGIRYCIERGADWIWLLNNDTVPDENSLARLMEIASTSPKAGVLGAVVYTPGNEGFVQSGTGTIDFKKAKTYERGVIDQSALSQQCQWISGCNLLFRSEAFSKVSGFDERFFLYFEDTDICYRLSHSGWQCLVVPAATLQHEGNVSTGEALSVWRSYYHTRNRLFFFTHHTRGLTRVLAFCTVFLHVLRHCLVLPFRGTAAKRQLRAELLGVRDFLTGKLGKSDCLDF